MTRFEISKHAFGSAPSPRCGYLVRVALALIAVLATQTAQAQALVIGAEQGAHFDAVLDGFPNIAALDGRPDFGGNALGAALKAGSVEERGIGEFPLDALGVVAAGDVAVATLTFNIDDVLSTFGPGADFIGAAAEEILVHVYDGNGTVEVNDFLAVARLPHVVDTRPFGRVSDGSLAGSGPLVFAVDITDDVRAVLESGAAAVGIVWRTMDTPTGTSLDNLGDSALGPPGAHASFMPYLTIELAAAATPTSTSELTATPTVTPEPSATATDTPVTMSCDGDCNGDGRVTIDELITGVNIALGQSVSRCLRMDMNGDDAVRVDELVRAVSALLAGC